MTISIIIFCALIGFIIGIPLAALVNAHRKIKQVDGEIKNIVNHLDNALPEKLARKDIFNMENFEGINDRIETLEERIGVLEVAKKSHSSHIFELIGYDNNKTLKLAEHRISLDSIEKDMQELRFMCKSTNGCIEYLEKDIISIKEKQFGTYLDARDSRLIYVESPNFVELKSIDRPSQYTDISNLTAAEKKEYDRFGYVLIREEK